MSSLLPSGESGGDIGALEEAMLLDFLFSFLCFFFFVFLLFFLAETFEDGRVASSSPSTKSNVTSGSPPEFNFDSFDALTSSCLLLFFLSLLSSSFSLEPFFLRRLKKCS